MTTPASRDTPGDSRVLPVCLAGIEPGDVRDVIRAEDMVVPGQFRDRDVLVVRVDGDGLAPAIRRGAYVGLDRTVKSIRSGGLYGVMVPVEGLVIKRAVVDPETRLVVLSDGQKKQPPYRFAPEEFRRRLVGRAVWVFQEF
jgi:phage repressor protein C with HTH and peptisase S24 domain